MNSHFDSIAEKLLKNSSMPITSFDKTALGNIRRNLDSGKINQEEAIDEFIKHVKNRSFSYYKGLVGGSEREFRISMIKMLPH